MTPLVAAIAAFNLICTGADTRQAGGRFEAGYRVDANAKSWCAEPCRESRPAYWIDDRQLMLSGIGLGGPNADYEVITINRESGAYLDRRLTSGVVTQREGFCAPRPFTGLPQRKF